MNSKELGHLGICDQYIEDFKRLHRGGRKVSQISQVTFLNFLQLQHEDHNIVVLGGQK